MNNAHRQFQENMARARNLGGLANGLGPLITEAVDVSDMWRAQLVLSVSALDHFIHEVVRLGMIRATDGQRPKTDSYQRFTIPAHAVQAALSGQSTSEWMGNVVREKHAHLSFQDPEKIADAIRLISPVELWNEVGVRTGLQAKDVKMRLKLIVERRNKIAHEADIDPSSPGYRWPITHEMAEDASSFIETVCNAILTIVV